jgi:hypothetical protein
VQEIDLDVETESQLPGTRQGHLTLLFDGAGLLAIEETVLSVAVEHRTFEDWWEPFTLGVGPAGHYVAELDLARQATLRDRCRALLPTAPFTMTAQAWAVRGGTT